MLGRAARRVVPVLLLILAAGCPNRPPAPQAKGEEQVRETFASFQAALKAGDGDRLWGLLDSESRADAERAAREIKEAYARAAPEEKAAQEKALGVSGAELSSLTGRGFLKTKRFLGKYDEVPDSTVDKVKVQGDSATVAYVEADGDHEKLNLVRQGGEWKVSVPMPRGTQP